MTATMNTERVPLSKLLLSTRNVRTNVEDATDTADLEASIVAHGLLNPLVVVPAAKKGTFEVVAGGRRYRALCRLADAGKIRDDAEVSVIKAASESAEELSLAENFVRKTMRPYEIYRAFTLLGGGDVADFAARFGISEAKAKRVLRLGNLHPEIFDAYSLGKLTDEQAQAFAATEKHDLQEQAWITFNKAETWNKDPRSIRSWLGLGGYAALRNLEYVGRDVYLAAGGTLEEDLFSDNLRVCDEELLAQLTAEKKAREAALAVERGVLVHVQQEADLQDAGRSDPVLRAHLFQRQVGGRSGAGAPHLFGPDRSQDHAAGSRRSQRSAGLGAVMAALQGRVTMAGSTFDRTKADKQSRYNAYRLRVLPDQLDRAERRYLMLRREALRYGLITDNDNT